MPAMQKSSAYHPVMQLLFLVLCCIVGAVVFSIIGLLCYFAMGQSVDFASLANANTMDIGFLRALQISISLGMFVAAPIAYAYINEVKPAQYLYLNKVAPATLFVLVFVLMLCATPLLEWLALVNQKMQLPHALKDLEIWMRAKETEAAMLTKKLLVMHNYSDLAINLLMIAIIPAVGEELFFRGGLQNIFGQWFKNPHIAIWLTAIVFSAIHVQFFGFFPRMFLGALFGYLLVYSGSIYLPMLGHFINNGSAVIMAFVIQRQSGKLDNLEEINAFNSYAYLISAILTLVLLFYFIKSAKQLDEQQLG